MYRIHISNVINNAILICMMIAVALPNVLLFYAFRFVEYPLVVRIVPIGWQISMQLDTIFLWNYFSVTFVSKLRIVKCKLYSDLNNIAYSTSFIWIASFICTPAFYRATKCHISSFSMIFWFQLNFWLVLGMIDFHWIFMCKILLE